MQLQFLGACGNQTVERETVSFVLHDADGRTLVDTGPGVVRQLYRSGLRCADISRVFVTHSHADHTAGFAYFVWSIFYDTLQGATPPSELVVVGLEGVLQGLRSNLEFCYDPSRFPFELVYEAVPDAAPGKVATGPGLTFTTVPVDHAVPTLGAVFEADGVKVAYSADTLYAPEFVDQARGCRLMIHEAFVTQADSELSKRTKHATAAEAGKAAAVAGAEQLALVHFYPPLADRLDLLVTEAGTEFGGRIFVPEDLALIEF